MKEFIWKGIFSTSYKQKMTVKELNYVIYNIILI